jgi:hypothetical protein
MTASQVHEDITLKHVQVISIISLTTIGNGPTLALMTHLAEAWSGHCTAGRRAG